MFNKNNYIRKNSTTSFNRLCISYIQISFRNLSLLKMTLLIIILLLFIIYIRFFNRKNQLCDPAESLWWFCPWPDPQTTVCSWEDHFPMTPGQNYSPESYAELFSSFPKVQSSFEFNNLTLIKCNSKSVDLLIFVISKCSHASIRQTIRRTWGNKNFLKKSFPQINFEILFLVDIDSSSSQKIELEYFYHKDIVQVKSLPEQYEYVTDREASLYQFVNQRCKQTKFIFKTDDDIFLNTFLLLLFVKDKLNSLKNETKYFLYGFPIEYALVVRHTSDNVGQRYIITKDEYSCSRYPTFLSGFGYLMSFETSKLFLNAYLTDIKPFPLSDVYFTGLLSQIFQIQRQTIFQNVDYHFQSICNEQFFSSENNPLVCAASNDHFNLKQSNGDTNLMNDYNLYWTILIEKYDSLKTNHR